MRTAGFGAFDGSGGKGWMVPKFVIEREVPGASKLTEAELREISLKSLEVLRQLGPDIQWVESYVAADKTFCVYLAKDEAIIRKHAEMSGFPATKITEVRKNCGGCHQTYRKRAT